MSVTREARGPADEQSSTAILRRTAGQAIRITDRLAAGMAYFSGLVFLLIAIYITLDVIGRRFFALTTAVSDEIGGYALACGGIWALAYTLRTGGHVRIDVLLPYLPRTLRLLLNYAAMVVMGVFSAVLGYYMWLLAFQSYAMEAKAMSFIQTPIWVPQTLVAVGLTALSLESVILLAAAILESCLAGRLAPLATLVAPGADEWEPAGAE